MERHLINRWHLFITSLFHFPSFFIQCGKPITWFFTQLSIVTEQMLGVSLLSLRWEKQLPQLPSKTPKSVIHPQYICREALMLWGKRGRETERMRSRSSLSKTNESCMSRQQQDDCSTWRSHPDETEEMRRVTFHWSWHWHIVFW